MAGANYDFPSDPKPLDDQGNWSPAYAQWVQRTHSNARTLQQSGSTADRPNSNLWIGRRYFDTDLGKMVWVASVAAGVATWVTWSGGGGSGDVVGPGSSVDSDIALFSGTTGKLIKDSGVLLSSLAPKASPALTGTPTAPTATFGTNTTQVATTAFVEGAIQVMPFRAVSANTTTVANDAGGVICHPAADTTARTWTIDSNANLPYPLGTAITFINQNAAGVITIAITSDVMRLAGTGGAGSRFLAANGMATAVKIATTEWIINGTGLT